MTQRPCSMAMSSAIEGATRMFLPHFYGDGVERLRFTAYVFGFDVFKKHAIALAQATEYIFHLLGKLVVVGSQRLG